MQETKRENAIGLVEMMKGHHALGAPIAYSGAKDLTGETRAQCMTLLRNVVDSFQRNAYALIVGGRDIERTNVVQGVVTGAKQDTIPVCATRNVRMRNRKTQNC